MVVGFHALQDSLHLELGVLLFSPRAASRAGRPGARHRDPEWHSDDRDPDHDPLMHARMGRLACGRLVGQRVTRLLPQTPRRLSTTPGPRTDGFNEALPRGDVVAPIVFGGLFAGAWYMAEEGRIKPLIDEIEPSTDPNAWPTPKQMFGHVWPFVASTLGMIFESVACKFSQTTDMAWLCTDAMNDDMKAAVALCLLVAPAEHSAAFVRTVNEHGTLRRIKEVVQIYKTLPREQHDDVMTNACVITAKVLPPVTTWNMDMEYME